MGMSTGHGNRKPARQYTRDLHRKRNGDIVLPNDEALDTELTLYWLRTVPGYREVIKSRVSEARKRQKFLDDKVQRLDDIDKLGREVDGCG